MALLIMRCEKTPHIATVSAQSQRDENIQQRGTNNLLLHALARSSTLFGLLDFKLNNPPLIHRLAHHTQSLFPYYLQNNFPLIRKREEKFFNFLIDSFKVGNYY